MKSRRLLYVSISCVVIVVSYLWFFTTRKLEYLPIFPATINHDCAPWDGGAFTLSIRYDPGTTITVLIWEAPDFKFPSTFSFPDRIGRVGYASILPGLDPLFQLSGNISLKHVEQGSPVEGEFNFRDQSGDQFQGKFIAEWGNEVAYCG